MNYGYPPHVPGENDRVMIRCSECGWTSKEMTVEEWHDLGHPWYCNNCDARVYSFVRYAPHERGEAYSALGLATWFVAPIGFPNGVDRDHA